MAILNLRIRFIIFKFHLAETMSENAVLPPNPEFEVPDADVPSAEVPNAELYELPLDLPELPMSVRINLAYQAWIMYRGTIPVRKIARSYSVPNSTLLDRKNGAVSKKEANQAKQRLSPSEEDALRDWMLELASWNWPVRPEQLRGMATELLLEKGDTKELGVHWTEQYLDRYPVLKTKYVAGLDKSRAKA
jgi:hypothetical protein